MGVLKEGEDCTGMLSNRFQNERAKQWSIKWDAWGIIRMHTAGQIFKIEFL